MSPIGSLTPISIPFPARFHEAGDQAFIAEVAQRNARHLELAVVGARTAGDLATVANPGCRRVARHLGELQRRREPLFHRLLLVGDDGLQLGRQRVVLGLVEQDLERLGRLLHPTVEVPR